MAVVLKSSRVWAKPRFSIAYVLHVDCYRGWAVGFLNYIHQIVHGDGVVLFKGRRNSAKHLRFFF